MNIWVCIKQVPDSESWAGISEGEPWLRFSESTPWRMNRFDEYALEAAIRLKESLPGSTVHVISMGPERVVDTIKRALGMGADNGVHIVSGESGYVCPSVTASRLAAVIRNHPADLILTGIMAEDMMQAQTGQMLARQLGMPCTTAVVKIDPPDEGWIAVEKELSGGARQVVRSMLPSVLTIQAGINTPRYPNISSVLKANKKEIPTVTAASLDTGMSPTESSLGVSVPEKLRAGVTLSGSCEEKAAELVKILASRNLLTGTA